MLKCNYTNRGVHKVSFFWLKLGVTIFGVMVRVRVLGLGLGLPWLWILSRFTDFVAMSQHTPLTTVSIYSLPSMLTE